MYLNSVSLLCVQCTSDFCLGCVWALHGSCSKMYFFSFICENSLSLRVTLDIAPNKRGLWLCPLQSELLCFHTGFRIEIVESYQKVLAAIAQQGRVEGRRPNELHWAIDCRCLNEICTFMNVNRSWCLQDINLGEAFLTQWQHLREQAEVHCRALKSFSHSDNPPHTALLSLVIIDRNQFISLSDFLSTLEMSELSLTVDLCHQFCRCLNMGPCYCQVA